MDQRRIDRYRFTKRMLHFKRILSTATRDLNKEEGADLLELILFSMIREFSLSEQDKLLKWALKEVKKLHGKEKTLDRETISPSGG